MKILQVIPIALTIAILTGCQEFLVEEPTTEIAEFEFFQTEENARLAVNAMYDPLGWGESTILGPGGHSYEFIFGDICSDDSEKGSVNGDQNGIQQLKDFTAAGGVSNINIVWSKHFVAIARANLVLKNLLESPIENGVKLELEAEARFVRAYSYFTIVRIFGGVPLLTEPVSTEQITSKDFERAPIYEVYSLIDSDFSTALSDLPNNSNEPGRATKGAAASYLLRSIIYQIGTDNTNNHTWEEAFELSNRIINGEYGSYSLESNYARIFETEGENNSESIFELQSVDNGVDPFSHGAYIGSEWTVFQNPLFMGGWGFNTPTEALANSYELNDPRRPSVALAVGEHAYGVEMLASERNKTGYYTRKAIVPPEEWVTEKGSGYNIRKLRYADVLLMNAEAAYHIGNSGQAIQRLEEIRNRASGSSFPKGFFAESPDEYSTTGFEPLDNSIIPSGGQELLEFIYLERRREFGMEQLRFWDLVRTGRYVQVMDEAYSTGTIILEHSITSSNKETPEQQIVNPIPLFPIPALEVANWNIAQNPGY